MYRDTTNAKYKMFDLTEKNWSYWNNNKIKEKFETVLGKHSIDSLHNTDVLGTSHTHTHTHTHTQYVKSCILKFEPKRVGINFVLRAEVPGRKSSDGRRDDCDDNDDDDNNNNNNNNVGFKNMG